MPTAGELVVHIESRAGRVTRATSRTDRPHVGARLFVGRPASQAPALARSLFAICGRSQAIAARSAVEAVQGVAADAATKATRDRAVLGEALQEHAWKVFVDAPRLAGLEPAIDVIAQERRALAALLDEGTEADTSAAIETLLAWSRRALLGCAPAEFLAMADLDAFGRWMREAGTPAASVCSQVLAQGAALGASDVPFLAAAVGNWVAGPLAAAIDADPAFDDIPHLEGTARETGALARRASHPLVAAAMRAHGRGVGARLVARLVEMASLLEEIGRADPAAHGAVATGTGDAIAWVETARGLLVHRVSLDGERIAAYRIVAPTEWNFHPDGAFARGALGVSAPSSGQIDACVRRLVDSLDPCVGVRYEASHA